MTALDDLWDFDDPAASEARFREAIDAAEADDDHATADEARTQLARAATLLSADTWLAEHEPDRIARLRRLGQG